MLHSFDPLFSTMMRYDPRFLGQMYSFVSYFSACKEFRPHCPINVKFRVTPIIIFFTKSGHFGGKVLMEMLFRSHFHQENIIWSFILPLIAYSLV